MSVDFAELKTRVSIVQVVDWLGIQTHKSPNGQLRACCPIHKGDNPRGFVVTPEKGLWYCFGGKCGGGDAIKLVAGVKEISQKEAAELIDQHFAGTVNSTRKSVPKGNSSRAPGSPLQPLAYLEPENDAVQALGVSAATAEAFESGFAGRGTMRGRYLVPCHSRDGVLLAYAGIATSAESPRLLFPQNFDPASIVWNAHRVKEGSELFLVRSPLDAILAVENGIGIESVIALLTETISGTQLEMISGLMDELKIEGLELP